MKDNYSMRIFEYDGDWICEFPDLPGCSGVGDTYEEAFFSGIEARDLWLESYFEEHGVYPDSSDAFRKEYSGKILVRCSGSLHRELALTAESEGVSLNQYCCQLLAEGIGAAKAEPKMYFYLKSESGSVKKISDNLNWAKNVHNTSIVFPRAAGV